MTCRRETPGPREVAVTPLLGFGRTDNVLNDGTAGAAARHS